MGKLHDAIPITPMHITSMWVFVVAISFLAVCICVFGGKYHGLATRDFKNVNVDGRLRLGGVDTKTVVGYTGVITAATAAGGGVVGNYWVMNSRVTGVPTVLTAAGPIHASAAIIPGGYHIVGITMEALVLPVVGAGAPLIGVGRSNAAGTGVGATDWNENAATPRALGPCWLE